MRRWLPLVALAALACSRPPSPPEPEAPRRPVLRVSADPNNLPFTNERGEGFENRLAEIVAEELGAELRYVWRAQRRGFFRLALKEGECDLVLGVPAGFDRALSTKPYYRSSYVFVRRKGDAPIRSFDDPRLKSLRVGVTLLGDDGANSPPAHALADRGIIDNVVGYSIYGDYREQNPPARLIEAVAAGEVDVTVAWGPMAGYFAARQSVPLEVTPAEPVEGLGLSFAIAMGVRRGDKDLRDRLDAILVRRRADVERILAEYHVPLVEGRR